MKTLEIIIIFYFIMMIDEWISKERMSALFCKLVFKDYYKQITFFFLRIH